MCSRDAFETYVSHVGGVQLGAGWSATAAAVHLLQAVTVAVQRVNVRVCEDETSSSDTDLQLLMVTKTRRPVLVAVYLRGGEDRETQSVV